MVTLATSKIFSRSKKVFKTARAAWAAVGRSTGLEPSDVRSAGHTKTAWRWVKKGVSRTKRVAKRRKSKRKSTSKPRRSAKQRANDKRLGQMAKRRGRSNPKPKRKRRSTTKRRTSPKRVIKRRTPSKSVVGRGSLKKVINNPILKKVLLAAGAVTVATSIAGLVAPSLVPTLQRPIVRAGLGFVTGDFVGAISNFVIGGGGLGQLTGGSGAGGASAVAQSTSGFA